MGYESAMLLCAVGTLAVSIASFALELIKTFAKKDNKDKQKKKAYTLIGLACRLLTKLTEVQPHYCGVLPTVLIYHISIKSQ